MYLRTSTTISMTTLLLGLSTPGLALTRPAALEGEHGLVVADGVPARLERTLVEVIPGHRRAGWAALSRELGPGFRATFDRDSGVPARIYGGALSAPGSSASAAIAQRLAEGLLARHLELLAPGAAPGDLVPIANDLTAGQRTVAFVQTHRGLDVLGGQLSFRFRNDRLFMIGSEAVPGVTVEESGAEISEARALRSAVAWLAADLGVKAEPQGASPPMILSIVRRDGSIDHHRVLEARVTSSAPIGSWSVYVDAGTGAPVARRQLLKFADGTIRFNAPERRPGGTRVDAPAAYTTVTLGGSSQSAGGDGRISWNGDGPADVVVRPVGQRVRVVNNTGSTVQTTTSLSPGGTFVFDRRSNELEDAQLVTFVAANAAKARAIAIAPDINWLQTNQLEANVNLDSACNAFSDGNTINFFQSGGGCENTGRLPDVVYHEFGHAVHFHAIVRGAGQFDTSLSEGAADYLAATMTDDSGMGRGFVFDNRPLRELDPNGTEAVWPDDINEDPHETGLIFAGAMWDLRKALIAALGADAGVAHSDHLWIEALRRAADIPTTYVEVLGADDDDGNLGNGTPNECAINDAFSRHGLADSAASGIGLGTPVATGLRIHLPINGSTQCPGSEVTGATLSWEVRGAPSRAGTIPMTPGTSGFVAELPPPGAGVVVRYRVEVTFGDGRVSVFPENVADPMYELFVGDVVDLYCTSFEGDPTAEGWSHELVAGQATQGADDWQFGAPAGTAGSGDPGAAFSGQQVAGNDLGGGNYNGLYQPDKTNRLIGPDVDTMGFSTVRLQYRRWLTVEDGFYDHARILANDQVVWSNTTGDMSGSLPHIDEEWRFHDVELTSTIQDGRVRVKFELESDRGLEMGGWTIDELCIVGYGGAVCGNGTIEPGETCDDGNQTDGDGCEASCAPTPVEPPPPEAVCGDGVLQAPELCDDGNTIAGDGCEDTCAPTDPGQPPACGNGIVELGEQCDDGVLDGRLCTSTCTVPAITGGQLDQQPASGCGCTAAEGRATTTGGPALAALLLGLALGLRGRRRARALGALTVERSQDG